MAFGVVAFRALAWRVLAITAVPCLCGLLVGACARAIDGGNPDAKPAADTLATDGQPDRAAADSGGPVDTGLGDAHDALASDLQPDGCTATLEVCNGLDDDCDDVVDNTSSTLCSVGSTECVAGSCVPIGGNFVAQTQLNGTAAARFADLAVLSDDSFVTSGWFEGTVNFGGGPITANGWDAFIALFNADRSLRWVLTFGGHPTAFEFTRRVAVDSSDNIVFSGGVTASITATLTDGAGTQSAFDFQLGSKTSGFGATDLLWAKLDKNGNLLWADRFGGTGFDDGAYGLALGADGSMHFSGNFVGSVDFGGGPLVSDSGTSDMVIAKYDVNGNHVWSKGFGGPGDDWARTMGVAPDGTVFQCGRIRDAVTIGTTTLQSAGGTDAAMLSLDSDGNPRWARQLGSTEDDTCLTSLVDNQSVIFAGGFRGSVSWDGTVLTSGGSQDIWIARLDMAGTLQTLRGFGGTGYDEFRHIELDAGRNLIGVGRARNTIDFGGGALPHSDGSSYDVLLVSLDADLNHRWSRLVGGQFDDTAKGLGFLSNGNLVVGGHFGGLLDFGGGPLTAQGEADLFVVELSD